jgi:hypothetical protein
LLKEKTIMFRLKKTRICTIILVLSLSLVKAHVQTDPIGGKPSPGSKPSAPDLEYQVKYQRAFEAVLWSMPAARHFHDGNILSASFEMLKGFDNKATSVCS